MVPVGSWTPHGFVVVGEAADADQACRVVDDTGPDLVITDIRLPTANGIDLAGRLVDEHPGLMVVILSAYDDEHYVRAARAAGVSGYLLKTLPSHELVAALRDACLAGTAGSTSPRGQGKKDLVDRGADDEVLTIREAEVVRLVARGMSNKAIAHHLGISPRTVEARPEPRLRQAGHRVADPARPLRTGQPPARTGHRRARPL